jgi:hypothetical protein
VLDSLPNRTELEPALRTAYPVPEPLVTEETVPNLSLYFNTPGAVVPVSVSFTNVSGQLVDPDTVTLVITDPDGMQTTIPAVDITNPSTGKYQYNFTADNSSVSGLYSYMWVGVGATVVNTCQVTPGTFRLFDVDGAAGVNRTYVSVEELKSSNNDKSGQTKDDYEYQRACVTATTLIHDLCGQHFFQITEPRTYSYDSIYELFTDPFVPGSITEFAVDYVGDGSYSSVWEEGRDFQTLRFNEHYNPGWLGEKRPHDFIRVLLSVPGSTVTPGGQMLPFVWAYSPNNRVKITATWGWPEIPQNVHHAALLLATDLFKMKDAPWGIAGMGELGMVKTQANPEVTELLQKYREVRNLVGV